MQSAVGLIQSAYRAFFARERVFMLTGGFVIGLIGGLGAVGVRLLIDGFQWMFDAVRASTEGLPAAAWLGIVLAPALGGAIIGPLIYYLAREAKGHGVPEVMGAVLQKGGYIRARVVLVKTLASGICIASGGSVGREGPIVQIGSGMGSTLGHLLRVPPRLMRTFVACGAAGGIAGTFNAPIAGAMFAVEIILGDFGFIQLAPIITSSVTATVVMRGILGNFAAFQVPAYELVHPAELLPYLGLGLLCGVAAVAFIRLLDQLEGFFEERLRLHEMLQPALGGLGIGVIGLAFPQIFGLGYGAIDLALHDGIPLLLLAALVPVKMAATSLTLASGGSGGIFAPSLFLGAMMGGAMGKVSNWVMPALTASSGAYALVGMAAMVGATTHAPITAIVIIFELTSDYKIILPLMISTIISVLTASTLYRESIYTDKLRRRGIETQRGLEANVLKRIKVKDIMRRSFQAAPRDLPFNFLADLVMDSDYSQLPVVDAQGRLDGVVSRDTVKRYLFGRELLSDVVIAHDLLDGTEPTISQEETLDQAMLRFQEFHAHELYVVDASDRRRVIGVLLKEDLMDAYQREMVKQESGDVFAYSINRPHRLETVDVMEGYGIVEVEAPHDFSGKRLRELDLRNRYGVTVLAIKRAGHTALQPTVEMWVPESADFIQDGDVLVLMGDRERIQHVQQHW